MSRLWLKDLLAILADGGRRGVADGRSVDPSRPVVLPGPISTHHHFDQTRTRAFPPARNRTLFPWLDAL